MWNVGIGVIEILLCLIPVVAVLWFHGQARRWLGVALATSILAIMLIYLILGQDSGAFVLSVADNVVKFANAVPTPSFIGLAVLLALIYLIMQRIKDTEPRDRGPAATADPRPPSKPVTQPPRAPP
jgi:hypothetical protein